MKIALFGKNVNATIILFIQEMIDKLQESNGVTLVYRPFFENLGGNVQFREMPEFFSSPAEIRGRVDFLFSIGGDGTMLDAVALVGDSGIPVAGINLGRLGFLSGISKNHFIPAIDAILAGNFILEKRTLIRLVSPDNLFYPGNLALNDLTIFKPNVMNMLIIKTWINGDFLNSYYADGLIVATPTGSTAYSLSCTGPIITPDSENFVITPIASHNLTVRPIVVRDDCEIRIRVEGKASEYVLSLDSRIETVDTNVELVVRKAEFKVNLLRLADKSFFETLREKMNWGLDSRS